MCYLQKCTDTCIVIFIPFSPAFAILEDLADKFYIPALVLYGHQILCTILGFPCVSDGYKYH